MTTPKSSITIYINEDTKESLDRICFESKRTKTELVSDLIAKFLATQPKQKKRTLVSPPIEGETK